MNLLISDMDSRTTCADLEHLLSEYGPVHTSNVRSIMDIRTRNFNTFCYVQLDTDEKGTSAIGKFNDTVLLGRKIKLEIAG